VFNRTGAEQDQQTASNNPINPRQGTSPELFSIKLEP
jgi:hypothetical protein